jgi:copper resistance protein C
MRALLAALVAATALSAASVVFAHPLLLESSPAADAVVPASPARVVLRFNNRIETRLSRVRLVDERGQRHALTVVPGETADRLVADAPVLAPGRYRVEWQVLSADGHVVGGRFAFRIAP